MTGTHAICHYSLVSGEWCCLQPLEMNPDSGASSDLLLRKHVVQSMKNRNFLAEMTAVPHVLKAAGLQGFRPHQESPGSPGAYPCSFLLTTRSFLHILFCKGLSPLIGTCPGCLPFTSTRIKSYAAAAAGLQHPLKGVQDGEHK